MDARRSLKQVYKSLVNEALDQCKQELASALKDLGSNGQLVTDKVTYDRLAAEAEATKKSDAPSLSSKLLKLGMTGLDSQSNNEFKKFADREDKAIQNATVFYSAKGLSNVWIYNKHLSQFFDSELVKKIFNVKRFEIALMNIKAELFPYDVDEIENPHADFKDFYFHQKFEAALLDYGIRAMKLAKKSFVNTIKLQFMLDEAKKSVQATINQQTVSVAEMKESLSEVIAAAESPRAKGSTSVAFTFISNPPVTGPAAAQDANNIRRLSH